MNKRKSIYRKSAGDAFRSILVPAAFSAVIMGMILRGLQQTETSSKIESLRILEESVRRAIVINYAINGSYPQSVNEIEARYGIHIDRKKYIVHYNVFASNIIPDMAVFEIASWSNHE